MIVKNEEDCIERCLKGVEHVVDEMIIVDTGSTDNTIDICKSYGATIHSFQWNHDFSAARNFGLEKASGDWILWLDADEEVDAKDRYKLRDVLYWNDYDLLSIHLINYYGETIDPEKVLSIAHPRLFRNGLGFKFQNRIHETLNVHEILSEEEYPHRTGLAPIKVFHYGYTSATVNKKEKFKRNLALLEQELQEGRNLCWTHYHIASEYYRDQQYEKSFEHVNLAIVHFLSMGLTPPSLLYKLKYSILLSIGSMEGAYEGIQRAITLYPDYADLHFYFGVILIYKKEFSKAIGAFGKCIEIGEGNLKHLVQNGLSSFQAWHYIGVCQEQLGMKEQAVHSYLKALSISSTFEPSIEKLREMIKDNEVIEIIKQYDNKDELLHLLSP